MPPTTTEETTTQQMTTCAGCGEPTPKGDPSILSSTGWTCSNRCSDAVELEDLATQKAAIASLPTDED